MKKRIVVLLLVIVVLLFPLGACNQAERASANISTAADNFQVTRRLVVINLRSDKVLFELVGVFSLSDETNRIVITCKTGANEYKKHFVDKGAAEVWWNIEDISGADVSSFKYEVNFLPEMLIPFDVVQKY